MSRRDQAPRLTNEPLKEIRRYVDQWSIGEMDGVRARQMIYRMLGVCQERMDSLEATVKTVVDEAEKSRAAHNRRAKKKREPRPSQKASQANSGSNPGSDEPGVGKQPDGTGEGPHDGGA